MLTHEAYLDTLQSIRLTAPQSKAVIAGLLVMRLIDAWLDEDSFLVHKDIIAVCAVREALAGVQEHDLVRPILCDLVDRVTQMEQGDVSSIASLMLAYGRRLHCSDHWKLALDVFASLLSHAQAVQDETTCILAASKLAFVLKHLGQLDTSDDVYALALQKSLHINRLDLYYTTYCGFANNLAYRGQLSEAEHIFNTALTKTSTLGLTEIHAMALHSLSSLAMARKDYSRAIQIAQNALEDISEPIARERLLATYGAALVGHGDHHMAKHIFIPMLQHTQQEEVRQRAMINLLEVAAKEADKPNFDRYRQELGGTIVLPEVQALYHLYVAKGHYIFKNPKAATEEWWYALEIATAHRFTQTCMLIHSEIVALDPNSLVDYNAIS